MTFLRVLLRRWDVVIPGLVLTAVTVMAAGASVAPAHEAQGSLLLLGPAKVEDGPVNPYLAINSSLEQTAVIVAESMRSEEIVRDLANLGGTAGYEVDTTQKTPILTVTARGSSREQVLYTADLVLQRVQEDLARRQQEAGAPAETFIRSQILSSPRASVNAGSKPRVMAAVGALGMGITIMLAFAVENVAAWRHRRRQVDTPASFGPVFAGFPHVSEEPAPHFSPEWEPAEAQQGNGWHQHAPSGPLVDVVTGTADPSPAEDPYEAGDPFEGAPFEGAPDEVPAQNEVSAQNGNFEQQDGLVDAWWSAWERRQAGRRDAQDAMEPTTYPPADDREEGAPENEHAAISSPREVLDDDEEANRRWDEDLVDQADGLVNDDGSESLLAWDGRIEVLGGTADVEPEAVSSRRVLPPAGGEGFAYESDT